jgi:glutathionylspermidine synthase
MTINYDTNTPNNKQSFAEWQEAFQQNFTQLGSAFKRNHIALDATSNAGNHTIIELLQQVGNPQVGTTEFAIYSKDVPDQTDQVFMRYAGNGTEFQFTNYQIYSLTDTTFFSFLPGKLICYFGLFNPSSSTKNSIFLNPPVARNLLSVNLTSLVPVLGSGASYTIPSAQNGILKKINVYVIGNPATINQHYYTIVANI